MESKSRITIHSLLKICNFREINKTLKMLCGLAFNSCLNSIPNLVLKERPKVLNQIITASLTALNQQCSRQVRFVENFRHL